MEESLIAQLKYLSNLDRCQSSDDMQNALEEISELLDKKYPEIEEKDPWED